MTVKQLLENFNDCGGSVIRIIADNSNFDIRIGYNYIDKDHPMWRNFIAMYGNCKVTKWQVENEEIKDIPYKVITLYIEAEEDKGTNDKRNFDHGVSYTVSFDIYADYKTEKYSFNVDKSDLAKLIENIFELGGYDVRIDCIERKNN